MRIGGKQTQHQKDTTKVVHTKHGMRYTSFYSIWCCMKKRCYNKKDRYYGIYGGRGVLVCEKWLKFDGFMNDMLDGYFEGASIERIDNDKGYELVNCKWIEEREQGRNRRSNKLSVELISELRVRNLNGESKISLAREVGCSKSAILRALSGHTWA